MLENFSLNSCDHLAGKRRSSTGPCIQFSADQHLRKVLPQLTPLQDPVEERTQRKREKVQTEPQCYLPGICKSTSGRKLNKWKGPRGTESPLGGQVRKGTFISCMLDHLMKYLLHPGGKGQKTVPPQAHVQMRKHTFINIVFLVNCLLVLWHFFEG